jgi:REP element-mobilizing transposase RayT
VLRAPFDGLDMTVSSCFVLIMIESKGWHSRGYLPHFDAKGVVQHIVLNTVNALTTEFFERLSSLEASEKRRRIDAALDASSRGRVFENTRCAFALETQLRHFDGVRYDLLAWCIMPNHVHVVLCCLGSTTLGQIIRTWKVQATITINAILGATGPIFARDYFDRFMRNGKQTERAIAYVESNPVAAGLCMEPADWRFSSAHFLASGWQPITKNLPLSLY